MRSFSGVVSQVLGKRRLQSELLHAYLAPVRFLFAVGQDVLLKAELPSECLVAQLAGVGTAPVRVVDIGVGLELGHLVEGSVACPADKVLLPGVDGRVAFEMRLPQERLVADGTDVGFLPGVDQDVLVTVGLAEKHFAAYVTFEADGGRFQVGIRFGRLVIVKSIKRRTSCFEN